MFLKKRYISALLACGVSLTACETPQIYATLKGKAPFGSLKSTRKVSPVVLQAFQLLKEEKYAEASKIINAALHDHPTNALFHVLNGIAYEKLADSGDETSLELAAIGYQGAINIEPTNVFAIVQLAKLKSRMKDYPAAQDLFANALLLKPDDANLLQELAAASYYSYDIQTALGAIKKAEKLKPEDPLIHRSAAMIYAALGDIETAKKHFSIFKKKLGDDPAVDHVDNRLKDWTSLHENGKIRLAAATTLAGGGTPATLEPPPPPPLPLDQPPAEEGGVEGGVEGIPEKAKQSQVSSQIIIDCYLLRMEENNNTTKGNNILTTAAVTLAPTGFTSFTSRLTGGGLSGTAPGSGTDHATNTPSAASGTNTNVAVPPTTLSPSSVTLTNAGGVSGHIFSTGITLSGVTYLLNIANAVDSRTELISRPSLMTFLKKQSTFFSGVELVAGLTGAYSGTLVKYPIGTTLTITPESLEGDVLTLNIGIEGAITPANANLNGSTVEVVKANINTFVKIRMGETLMLGGIYERFEGFTKSGFPGLSDVPGLQYFFSQEQTTYIRRSVMYMITPRSPDLVKSAIDRAMSREIHNPYLKELTTRNPDWFNPSPSMVSALQYLRRDPMIYYEFRTADVLPPSWGWEPSTVDKLDELTSFLYY